MLARMRSTRSCLVLFSVLGLVGCSKDPADGGDDAADLESSDGADTTGDGGTETETGTDSETGTETETGTDTAPPPACETLDEAACEARDDCARFGGTPISEALDCTEAPRFAICLDIEAVCNQAEVNYLDPEGQCWWFTAGCIFGVEGWQSNSPQCPDKDVFDMLPACG